MIRVICKREADVYNAYHMTRAFYPAQEVVSCVEETPSDAVTVEFPDGNVVAVPDIDAALCETAASSGKNTSASAGGISSRAGKERKRHIGRCLYKKLSERTGKTLPWGMLTGVRPTKLATGCLENGMEQEEFTGWFAKEYFVSSEKAELAWKIAKRERRLLSKLDSENGFSLYVGIPFCPSVCSYCSFSSGSLTEWKDRVEDYLDALQRELDAVAHMASERRLNTIYIGGGTPTSLTPAQLERLLSRIDADFSRQFLLEYTVEAGRPDSITGEKLKVLREHGVTRISVNPQSMQQKTLDRIGRRHTVEDVYRAYRLARECGFDNINMDLIAGLPGETSADMADTLAQVKELAPDSLTVHSLAIKRAARMGQEIKSGRKDAYINMSPDIQDMIAAAARAAADMGMPPYYLYRQKNIAGNFENVGYAKAGKAGIYNVLIMEEKQTIAACGAGGITKRVCPDGNLKRCENVKDIAQYIARTGEMADRKRRLAGA